MWPEILFIVLVIAAWSVAYSAILPRLILNPISGENNVHPTRPTLSGVGFLAWLALMAFLNLACCWGYLVLREYRRDRRLFFMGITVSVFFLIFRHPSSVDRDRDPDVRFGSFLGALVGCIAALLLRAYIAP